MFPIITKNTIYSNDGSIKVQGLKKPRENKPSNLGGSSYMKQNQYLTNSKN